MKKVNIGLALSQGGARGLTHIGVLKVLEKQGIEIDQISGTSIGAVIGAMYAETMNAEVVHNRFKELIQSEVYQNTGVSTVIRSISRETNFWDQITSKIKETLALTMAQTKQGLLSQERFSQAIKLVVRSRDFCELKVPLIVISTDLTSGQEIPLCSGDLLQAVISSASVPGFFPPVSCYGHLLTDGAICCPVPVKYARYNKNSIVIAVSVLPNVRCPVPLDNAFDIMIRAEEINLFYLSQLQANLADVAIFPEVSKAGDIHWTDFHLLDQLVEIGQESAYKAIPTIKEAIQHKKFWLR